MGWQRLTTAFDQAQSLFREPRSASYVTAAGLTDIGRVRRHNEDAFAVTDLTTGRYALEHTGARFAVGERGVLLAVSDGMGGAAAGEVASSLVIESIQSHLDRQCRVEDQLESLECAVERANRDVWDAAQSADRRGMGATLAAVVIYPGFALVASVGDSRAHVIRHGAITQVTKDHSYVQMLVDAGVLNREEAAASPYRNVILQAMGTRPSVTVALGRLELRRGDRFLLCSDGLSEKVSEREMLDAVARSPKFSMACERLVDLANVRGGEDNITVIVGEVAGDELPKAERDESVARTFESIQEFTPK